MVARVAMLVDQLELVTFCALRVAPSLVSRCTVVDDDFGNVLRLRELHNRPGPIRVWLCVVACLSITVDQVFCWIRPPGPGDIPRARSHVCRRLRCCATVGLQCAVRTVDTTDLDLPKGDRVLLGEDAQHLDLRCLLLRGGGGQRCVHVGRDR